jgi:hypothetical protein
MAGWRNARLPGAGGSSSVTYTEVTTSPLVILTANLKEGINIFGIVVNSIVEILIPRNLPDNKIIAIKDESGNAKTNHIIIRVRD